MPECCLGFALTTGIKKPMRVERGTRTLYANHVAEIEKTLGLQTETYQGVRRWVRPDRDIAKIADDALVCEAVEKHNQLVWMLWRDLAKWQKEPPSPAETLTPKQAAAFWYGLCELRVPPERWTPEFYEARMQEIYECLRGRDDERVTLGVRPLSIARAGAVIDLFSTFLDIHDIRLAVPRGCDHLSNSDDYRWCERCGAIDPDNLCRHLEEEDREED